jgi:predicted metal-dependent hydrolase
MRKNVTPPDPCSGPIDPRALTGIRCFNAGEYFEAHEWLETAWREERGEIRNLYRGILQVGVGYHHLTRGNYTGAIKLFERCRQWLEPFPGDCLGIDVAGLWQDFTRVEAEVKRLGEKNINQFNRALLKPVRFLTKNPSSEEHT